jgi:hypothetical protein
MNEMQAMSKKTSMLSSTLGGLQETVGSIKNTGRAVNAPSARQDIFEDSEEDDN